MPYEMCTMERERGNLLKVCNRFLTVAARKRHFGSQDPILSHDREGAVLSHWSIH
jgi:hypothetical protein